MANNRSGGAGSKPPTPHEPYVLRAVAELGSVASAAKALDLSVSTVEKHIENLRMKTDRRSVAAVILFLADWGLLDARNDFQLD